MVAMPAVFDGWLCWGVTVLDMGVPPGKKDLVRPECPTNELFHHIVETIASSFFRKIVKIDKAGTGLMRLSTPDRAPGERY
jgi:hypothetical protein